MEESNWFNWKLCTLGPRFSANWRYAMNPQWKERKQSKSSQELLAKNMTSNRGHRRYNPQARWHFRNTRICPHTFFCGGSVLNFAIQTAPLCRTGSTNNLGTSYCLAGSTQIFVPCPHFGISVPPQIRGRRAKLRQLCFLTALIRLAETGLSL